jgi:hypothetical protein
MTPAPKIDPETVAKMLEGITSGDASVTVAGSTYEEARFIAWARKTVPALAEERDALETAREMLGGFWVKAEARAKAAEAKLAAQEDLLMDLLASLTASISLLERSPKTAAPSDRMFDMMLGDYRKSADRARAALQETGK